jgi:hypothetical protein
MIVHLDLIVLKVHPHLVYAHQAHIAHLLNNQEY